MWDSASAWLFLSSKPECKSQGNYFGSKCNYQLICRNIHSSDIHSRQPDDNTASLTQLSTSLRGYRTWVSSGKGSRFEDRVWRSHQKSPEILPPGHRVCLRRYLWTDQCRRSQTWYPNHGEHCQNGLFSKIYPLVLVFLQLVPPFFFQSIEPPGRKEGAESRCHPRGH